jgi:hypothetical protein
MNKNKLKRSAIFWGHPEDSSTSLRVCTFLWCQFFIYEYMDDNRRGTSSVEYMERAEPRLGGYLKQEQNLGGYQGDS